jgi:hypothetical protein
MTIGTYQKDIGTSLQRHTLAKFGTIKIKE